MQHLSKLKLLSIKTNFHGTYLFLLSENRELYEIGTHDIDTEPLTSLDSDVLFYCPIYGKAYIQIRHSW